MTSNKTAKTLLVIIILSIVCLVVLFSTRGFSLINPRVAPSPSVIATELTPEPTAEPTLEPTAEPTPEIKKEPIFTDDHAEGGIVAAAETVKELLEKYTDNENLICGIMGMFMRESKFHSYRVAHQRGNSEAWTAEIDAGLEDGSTREYFYEYTSFTSGGYGLAQWSGDNYCHKLYDFAKEWGTSIGDADMQCAFVIHDMQERFPDLYEAVCNSKTPYDAGALIGTYYERTAEYYTAANNAKTIYNAFYSDTEDNELFKSLLDQ